MPAPYKRFLIACGIAAIATMPFFVNAYRVAAVNAVPLDNYQRLLLELHDGSLKTFSSPFGYRVLTLICALPLLSLHPPQFTNISGRDADWITATFALCAVSHLFLLLFTIGTLQTLTRLRVPLAGAYATLVIFWCAPAREIYSYPLTDAATLFFIGILWRLYLENYLWFFSVTALIGVTASEKVPLVIGLYLIIECLFNHKRQRDAARFLAGLLPAVILYWLAHLLLRFPGGSGTPGNITACVERLFALPSLFWGVRGLLLNAYPLWPLVLAAFFAMRHVNAVEGITIAAHIIIPVILILIGAAFDVQYNIGRIAFLSFPFFTPILGKEIAAMLSTDRTIQNDEGI